MTKTNIKEIEPLKSIHRAIRNKLAKLEGRQVKDKKDAAGCMWIEVQSFCMSKVTNRKKQLSPFYYVLSKINRRTKSFYTDLSDSDEAYIKKFISMNFKDISGDDLVMCLKSKKEDWVTRN